MATVRDHRRSSISPRAWAVLNRAREEIEGLPLFHSPPHSWFHLGTRNQELRLVANFLRQFVSAVRQSTQDFRQAIGEGDYDHDGLAEGLLWAVILMQSHPLPGRHQTCMMCPPSVTENRHWYRDDDDQNHMSVRLRHLSSCGYWTLNEIGIVPNLRLRDVDSPRLCRIHGFHFSRALRAVLGFVVRPAQGSTTRQTAQRTAALQSAAAQRALAAQSIAALVLVNNFMVSRCMETPIPEALFGRTLRMSFDASVFHRH